MFHVDCLSADSRVGGGATAWVSLPTHIVPHPVLQGGGPDSRLGQSDASCCRHGLLLDWPHLTAIVLPKGGVQEDRKIILNEGQHVNEQRHSDLAFIKF